MKFAFKTMLYVFSIVFIVLGVTNVLNTAAMIALGIIIFSVVTFWAMYDTENNEVNESNIVAWMEIPKYLEF